MTADPSPSEVPAGLHRVTRTLAPAKLAEQSAALFQDGFRLGLVAAHDDGATLRVVYLFLAGAPDRRVELQVTLPADHPQLPTLASLSFPASRFEREMHDLFGIVALDHPRPHRLVRHAHWPAGWYPMRHDAGPPPPFTDTEAYPFLEVKGNGVYEIPVGPVHAGVIEPGHFRFSTVGESILKLDVRLGWKYRGLETLARGAPVARALEIAERACGLCAFSHALAFSAAVEEAAGVLAPPRARALRSLAAELERVYNHCADLSGILLDVAYAIGAAEGQRANASRL